jgi:hypothetical protein
MIDRFENVHRFTPELRCLSEAEIAMGALIWLNRAPGARSLRLSDGTGHMITAKQKGAVRHAHHSQSHSDAGHHALAADARSGVRVGCGQRMGREADDDLLPRSGASDWKIRFFASDAPGSENTAEGPLYLPLHPGAARFWKERGSI